MKVGDKFNIKGVIKYKCSFWGDAPFNTSSFQGEKKIFKIEGEEVHFEREEYPFSNHYITTKEELYRVGAFKKTNVKQKDMKEYKVVKLFPTQKNELKVGDVINNTINPKFLKIAAAWPEYFEDVTDKFKVGDNLIRYKGGRFGRMNEGDIAELTHYSGVGLSFKNYECTFDEKNYRKATPEEIAASDVIKSIGTRNATLTIKGTTIHIEGKRETLDAVKLKQFYNAVAIAYDLGGFSVKNNKWDEKVYLVGCTDESNYVSLNEIQKVLEKVKF